MNIIEVFMPSVTVYCPRCDYENEINGDEFELNGFYFIGSCYCESCEELITAKIK